MPDADRASRHQIMVSAVSSSRQLNLASELKDIRLDNFIYCSLPWQERLVILAITGLLLWGGIFSFIKWSLKLKADAEGER